MVASDGTTSALTFCGGGRGDDAEEKKEALLIQ